jgi:gentisate 1,2-dioxygenase
MLGTLEELPADYLADLGDEGLAPLWPQMRNLLPHGAPISAVVPHLWAYGRARPLLMRAGELTPVEKAERRVLVLCNPGFGGALQASATIYCGLQLMLPGEAAPSHRHTPSAARILVEGEGGYTVVDGKKCLMKKGDLILTPGGMWHDHGHEGDQPVVWLDALDLPLMVYLEGSFAQEGIAGVPDNQPDPAEALYSQAGLIPAKARGAAISHYPMLRFPFSRTRAALDSYSRAMDSGLAEFDYVNPENGAPCLPTLGFTAMRIDDRAAVRPPRNSTSSVFHIVEGRGRTIVNDIVIDWKVADSFAVPPFAVVTHEVEGEAYLIRIHDRPLQEALRFYSERPR